MTTIFNQNDNLPPFCVKIVVICEFAQLSKPLFVSHLEINNMIQQQNLEVM
jgi:hypothetical protein